jgi:hypothetical protein
VVEMNILFEKDWIIEFSAAFVVNPSKGLSDAEVDQNVQGSQLDLVSLPLDNLGLCFLIARINVVLR